MGVFFFIIFGCYTYGLALGGVFVYEWISKDGVNTYYAAGDVIAVFFGIVFGVFAMGMAAPHIKGVNEGREALHSVLEVIWRKPAIILNDLEKSEFDSSATGDIIFENVSFHYESW